MNSRTKNRPGSLEVDSFADVGSPGAHVLESPVPTSSSSNNREMQHFETEKLLKFHPPGAWQSKFCSSDGISYEYHLSTSFLKPGFTITCPTGIDGLKVVCFGICTFKVLYSKEDDEKFGSGVVLSEITVPPAENGQRQRVEVKTPWPCMKVEAVVDQQNEDFVAIFSVNVWSTSRPSSLSTPINEGKQPASWKVKGDNGIIRTNPRWYK
jgi:hypothetical protein